MIDEKTIAAFLTDNGLRCGAEARYIDLTSEVGELGKELLKATDYHRLPLRRTEDMEEEAGDCLFSLLALCAELELDPAAALRAALAKYKRRLAASGEAGSGR